LVKEEKGFERKLFYSFNAAVLRPDFEPESS